MQKQNNNKIHIIWKILLGTAFLIFGIGMLIYNVISSDYSISTLSYYHTNFENKNNQNVVLHTQITAQENNLGIIAVKFINNREVRDKKVTFILNDVKTKQKIHSATFNPNYFDQKAHYAFGFKPIPNSKNRTYEIILIPSDKRILTDLIIEPNTPIISKYAFNATELTDNLNSIMNFFFKKIYFYLQYFPNQVKVGFFFTPFIVFVLAATGILLKLEKGIILGGKYFPKKYHHNILKTYNRYAKNRTYFLFASSIPLWITLQVLMQNEYNFLLYFLIVIYIIFIALKYKLSATIFIYYECYLLIATIICSLINKPILAEIFAIWIYTLFWFISLTFIHDKTYNTIQSHP